MFSQPHFSRAESPVLITHQTQNRQQLRLRETRRRKTMTVRRHNFAAHFQRHTVKRHKSNFTHASSIYTQLQIVQVPFQQCYITSNACYSWYPCHPWIASFSGNWCPLV